MPEIKVGPCDSVNGEVYRYTVDGQLSQESYANRASALHAAQKPQSTVAATGLLVPASELERS